MVALVGMATAYAESALAQLYKVRNEDGQYRGGRPSTSLTAQCPWAAAIFSVCLIISFGLVSMPFRQTPSPMRSQGAFGVPKLTVGFGLAVLSGVVIFGASGRLPVLLKSSCPSWRSRICSWRFMC